MSNPNAVLIYLVWMYAAMWVAVAVLNVLCIGKERKPISPAMAVGDLVTSLAAVGIAVWVTQ